MKNPVKAIKTKMIQVTADVKMVLSNKRGECALDVVIFYE
jgi:hypothetical protein